MTKEIQNKECKACRPHICARFGVLNCVCLHTCGIQNHDYLWGEELSKDKPKLVNGDEPRIDSQPQNKECCRKCSNSAPAINNFCNYWRCPCHQPNPMQNTKNSTQEWEKEFEDYYLQNILPRISGNIEGIGDELKSFIRNLLASQKEKMEKERIVIKKGQTHTVHDKCEDCFEMVREDKRRSREGTKDGEFKVKKLDLKNRNYFSNQAAEEVFETINEIIDYLARTRSH